MKEEIEPAGDVPAKPSQFPNAILQKKNSWQAFSRGNAKKKIKKSSHEDTKPTKIFPCGRSGIPAAFGVRKDEPQSQKKSKKVFLTQRTQRFFKREKKTVHICAHQRSKIFAGTRMGEARVLAASRKSPSEHSLNFCGNAKSRAGKTGMSSPSKKNFARLAALREIKSAEKKKISRSGEEARFSHATPRSAFQRVKKN